MKYLIFSISLFTSLAFVGCGNSLSCSLHGDNVNGRVTFADHINISSNSDVRAEWSTNNFQEVTGGSSVYNLHGLPTFGYSMCADNGTVQFRIYQDTNRNKTLDPGENVGRYDRTSDGDASYINSIITSATEDNKLYDIDITIDNTL